MDADLYRIWAICISLVPLCHFGAIVCTSKEKQCRPLLYRMTAGITFAFAGGPRTFVFQLLSWSMWWGSALLGTSMISFIQDEDQRYSISKDMGHVLDAVAVFSSSMSLAFMIKSVLVFDPHSRGPEKEDRNIWYIWWNTCRHAQRVVEWDVSRLPSALTASYIVVMLGLLWAVVGLGLLFVQRMHGGLSTPMGIACSVFSAICFILSAFTIHGLGGLLRHARLVDDLSQRGGNSTRDAVYSGGRKISTKQYKNRKTKSAASTTLSLSLQNEWRFFQPFEGGKVFVATQATGWVLMSTALVIIFWSIGIAVTRTAEIAHQYIQMRLQSLTMAAGLLAMVAEVVLAFSLLFFNMKSLRKWTEVYGDVKSVSLRSIEHVACMSILYIPMHLTFALIASTFLFMRPLTASLLWLGVLPIYFFATGVGVAEKTGSREWPAFQAWLGAQCERVLPSWFGHLDVFLESGASFSKHKRYVFGYLPHGLYPLGAAYLPLLPKFRRLLPEIHPPTLSASIVFQIPLMRDLLLWTGLREVTRSTFISTLKQRNSLIVVPGGQAELVETHKFSQRKCAFYHGHKGFVRLALQEGAHLVPIVVFGEVTSLKNFIDTPKLHRWTYKMFGFPLPYLIGGRMGILPFPSREGLTFVIGKPLPLPSIAIPGNPTEEEVLQYHHSFYLEAKRLWNVHRKSFEGYEDIEAILV